MDESMSVTSHGSISKQGEQCSLLDRADFAYKHQQMNVKIVVELIDTLYNSVDPEHQKEANRILTEIQSSDDAWNICLLILDTEQTTYPDVVYFFAANLLNIKINQSWSTKNIDWLESELRPKLLETLVNHAASSNGKNLIIERLALSLANFALHSISSFWPNAIMDLIKTFTRSDLVSKIPHQRICDILLKILTYIPEEYALMIPGPNDRAALTGQITESGPSVFNFLRTLLKSDNASGCRPETLKCLTSWIMHSETCPLEVKDGKELLSILLEAIKDDELCGSACAALAATFDCRKAEKFRNTVIEFMPKLASLKPIIDNYIMQEEVECVIKIYSLVINFCENHPKLMVKIVLDENVPMDDSTKEAAKQAVFALIRTILDCTAAPGIFGMDEKYSEIAFPFWFSFFEVFYYYLDSYADTICDLFDPLVDSLMQILVKKAQYPPSSTYNQLWNDDQREDYRRYRHDLGDVLSQTVQFPRARDRIIEQLYEQLKQEFQQLVQVVQSGSNRTSDDYSWQGVEAIIFALKSMSESIPYDEEKNIPKIFDLISQIPFGECQTAELYCTTTEMIAAYSDWLFTHVNYLPMAYKILFLGVTAPNSYVRLMSTMALKDITSECQAVLTTFAPDIVRSCSNALLKDGQALDTMEKSRLMHTFGCAVVMTPSSTIIESLTGLTAPIVFDLGINAKADPISVPSCRAAILDRLHILNSLIEALHVKQRCVNAYEDADENNFHLFDPSSSYADTCPDVEGSIGQPAICLLRELIPILNDLVGKYKADEDVIGKVSDTIKKSAKTLNLELKPVCRELIAILVDAYDPIMNFNIILDSVPLYNIFKVDPSVHGILRDAFVSISEKTLNYCLTSPLRQLTITVEVYFRYAHLVLKKFSEFITDQPCYVNIELIYKLALASLELPEKKTLAEVCSFLTLYRVKSLGVPHLHSIFVNHLDLLLTNIFCIFGGNFSTPRNAIDTVSDLAFFILDAQEARDPLMSIVHRQDFPSVHVTKDQKSRFVTIMLQESRKKNRRKFKDACTEFALTARNLTRAM